MRDKATEIFENAPVPKAVLLNVIPSIISMMMVLVYNLADTFFIGQTGNPYMVAAVSVATPIFLLFMAVGMLFGIGGTSLISRLLGEGNRDKASNVSAFCFWTGLVIGILGMFFIWTCIEPICRLIGTSSDTIGYAKEYLRIVAPGVPFLVVSNCFSSIIRSEGKANVAMMGMILGNVTNIVLDPIMILGFGWGVAGAALATTIGNVAAAIFYVTYLVSKRSMLTISPRKYSVKNGIVGGVLAIGIPASLNSIMMSSSNIIINNLMNTYGDMAVAGLGVAMKVNMIVVMLLIGLGTGIQPLLGYCYGAKNKKRFLSVLKFSLVLALCLSLVMTFICYFGAGPMVKAFLDNPDAFQFGMQFARIYILSGPIMGILFVLINTLQGMGAAFPSLILSVSRQGLIYIPVLLFIYNTFDEARILVMSQPITDYLAVTLAIILFFTAFKNRFGKTTETTPSTTSQPTG